MHRTNCRNCEIEMMIAALFAKAPFSRIMIPTENMKQQMSVNKNRSTRMKNSYRKQYLETEAETQKQ